MSQMFVLLKLVSCLLKRQPVNPRPNTAAAVLELEPKIK